MIMKYFYRYLGIVLIATILFPAGSSVYAGNKDRSGQAGASELLINPYVRSSGWGNVNMSRVRGVEALWGNIAGAAFTTGNDQKALL